MQQNNTKIKDLPYIKQLLQKILERSTYEFTVAEIYTIFVCENGTLPLKHSIHTNQIGGVDFIELLAYTCVLESFNEQWRLDSVLLGFRLYFSSVQEMDYYNEVMRDVP